MEEIFHSFPKILTKRDLLQSTASIFDLLGFITHVVIPLKKLNQVVCSDKFKWVKILSRPYRES